MTRKRHEAVGTAAAAAAAERCCFCCCCDVLQALGAQVPRMKVHSNPSGRTREFGDCGGLKYLNEHSRHQSSHRYLCLLGGCSRKCVLLCVSAVCTLVPHVQCIRETKSGALHYEQVFTVLSKSRLYCAYPFPCQNFEAVQIHHLRGFHSSRFPPRSSAIATAILQVGSSGFILPKGWLLDSPRYVRRYWSDGMDRTGISSYGLHVCTLYSAHEGQIWRTALRKT